MRNVTIPVMIRIMKLRERIVMRWSLHPDVVDPDFFARPQIVVHDHPLRANDSHFTDFSRFEPAALDGGESLVREEQRHIGHVLHLWTDMCIALAVNRNWEFAEDVQD